MRSFLTISALAAVAAALPAANPQDIDFSMVMAAPDPTYTQAVGVASQIITYNTAAILASATAVSSQSIAISDVASTTLDAKRMAKRSACATQPSGATGAPTVSPDTPSAFASNTAFAATASAAPVPSGYTQTFQNLDASNNAYGYMGFTTLQTYDTEACAASCNAINGCMAVNIYFERDPSLNPGTGCTDPASVTTIKCVFWGGPVNTGNANNYGQYRSDFEVVVAGSNGYVNDTVAAPAGYTDAVYLGNAAINAPYDSNGYNTYMGSTIFNKGPFNASLCADYCNAQNVYNLAHPPTDGSPVQTCQFFNTYILYLNTPSDLQGQYCAIYSETWSSSYATNEGQYRGNDHYMVEYSYSFSNKTDAGFPDTNAAVHQASKEIAWSTLQPFCSTILGYTAASTTTVATVTATTTVAAVKVLDRRATTTTAAAAVVSTPAGLTKYPASVVTSACMLQATAVPLVSVTETLTVTAYSH